MERYARVSTLGKGAHGVVYLCEMLRAPPLYNKTKQSLSSSSPSSPSSSSSDGDGDGDEGKRALPAKWVAMKKIHTKDGRFGLPMEAIREIKLLQELSHPNIVGVYDVFHHRDNVYVVLEYMQTDLNHLIRAQRQVPLSEADVKAYLQMMLRGVAHCHAHWVLHRDIKPENFLLGDDGSLKLADFGLGRVFGDPEEELSSNVCTLWYRAPELLYGARFYGGAVDVWSVGCVFAELLARRPYLRAERESDLSQLGAIFAALGTPSPDSWPDVGALPNYLEFERVEPPPLERQFPAASPAALDLLAGLLTLNPNRRLTAAAALEHAFFSSEPAPTPLRELAKKAAIVASGIGD